MGRLILLFVLLSLNINAQQLQLSTSPAQPNNLMLEYQETFTLPNTNGFNYHIGIGGQTYYKDIIYGSIKLPVFNVFDVGINLGYNYDDNMFYESHFIKYNHYISNNWKINVQLRRCYYTYEHSDELMFGIDYLLDQRSKIYTSSETFTPTMLVFSGLTAVIGAINGNEGISKFGTAMFITVLSVKVTSNMLHSGKTVKPYNR